MLLFASACGAQADHPGSDGGIVDGGEPRDVAIDGTAAGCVSPGGYAICGGPRGCFPAANTNQAQGACSACIANYFPNGYDAALCLNAVEPDFQDPPAHDGQVYIENAVPNLWNAVPFEVGQLFDVNGMGARVRYGDWSAWSGATLPVPTSCPSGAGYETCGGGCPPCAAGQLCSGRSPTHRYGLCLPTDVRAACTSPSWTCPVGESCVVFAVDAASQALADTHGTCFPAATCQAIATMFPGGAQCH